MNIEAKWTRTVSGLKAAVLKSLMQNYRHPWLTTPMMTGVMRRGLMRIRTLNLGSLWREDLRKIDENQEFFIVGLS